MPFTLASLCPSASRSLSTATPPRYTSGIAPCCVACATLQISLQALYCTYMTEAVCVCSPQHCWIEQCCCSSSVFCGVGEGASLSSF